MRLRLHLLMLGGALVLVTIIVHIIIVRQVDNGHTRGHNLQERKSLITVARLSAPASIQSSATASTQSSPAKVVLMHSFPQYYELKPGVEAFSMCDHPCELTLNPDMVDVADSVIVYSHHLHSLSLPATSHHLHSLSLPATSVPNQTWIYFAVESPVHSDNAMFAKPEWHRRFNWTMTYRRDSDFYFGYGDFQKGSSPTPARDFSAIAAGKSKMVAWFVSNCHTQSKREDVVAALQDFVKVDVYGHCGKLQCDRSRETACQDMLSKDYYFYLSFENSLCKDYITEKVYHILRDVDVVPVVMGGANYTALLPPNSFIDASQFPSIQALAQHLKWVAENKAVYQSYLAWKNEWEVLGSGPFLFCKLCQRLHHPDRWAKVYDNVDAWWRDGICHEPPAVIKS